MGESAFIVTVFKTPFQPCPWEGQNEKSQTNSNLSVPHPYIAAFVGR
jgi:hypothetical protein